MPGWNARFAGTFTTPLWGMITGKFPQERHSAPCLITGVAQNVMAISINSCCCMSLPDPLIALLVAHFREVEVTRMRDVPILNAALRVETVGEYECQPNHAPSVGTFYTCSLFSPVLQFENQAAAVLTAQEVMKLMLGVPPSANVSRRDFLRGKFS